MANHPNRSKPFRVSHQTGMDTPGKTWLVIEGHGRDDTFAQGLLLAEFVERVLNAAYAAAFEIRKR